MEPAQRVFTGHRQPETMSISGVMEKFSSYQPDDITGYLIRHFARRRMNRDLAFRQCGIRLAIGAVEIPSSTRRLAFGFNQDTEFFSHTPIVIFHEQPLALASPGAELRFRDEKLIRR